MPQFFIILLKINVVLLLFAAAYYLILRRLTFYTLNRIFLAFGILFATIYPFINLTEFYFRKLNAGATDFVPRINQKVTELAPSDFITSNWQVISIVFYVGVAVMAGRLILQFVSLYFMHKKSQPGTIGNYPVRILGESVSPFSFWQTVYINPSLHQETELKTILEHENVHVRQWHSLDIIMAELSVVFYWFNPGVWMMKKAVKENLEFITDQKILNKGIIDRKTYQYSLLDVGNLTPSVAIVNNFNLSDLKKRIKMMNIKRSSPVSLSRYLLVTPLILVTTLAFTVSKKEMTKTLLPLKRALISVNIIDAAPEGKKESETVSVKTFKKISKRIKVDSVRRVKYLMNTIYLRTDSLGDSPKSIQTITVTDVEIQPTKRFEGKSVHTITSTDTAIGDGLVKRLENLKIEIRNPAKGQLVATDPAGIKTFVVVRGFKTADSLKSSKVNFSYNGKPVTAAEFSRIKATDVDSISVKKGDPNHNEIIVIGRAKGVKLN